MSKFWSLIKTVLFWYVDVLIYGADDKLEVEGEKDKLKKKKIRQLDT